MCVGQFLWVSFPRSLRSVARISTPLNIFHINVLSSSLSSSSSSSSLSSWWTRIWFISDALNWFRRCIPHAPNWLIGQCREYEIRHLKPDLIFQWKMLLTFFFFCCKATQMGFWFGACEIRRLNQAVYIDGKYISCMNRSCLLGFRPRIKTKSSRVYNYDNFVRVFNITNHLLKHHSLYFAPLFWVNEWMASVRISNRLSHGDSWWA